MGDVIALPVCSRVWYGTIPYRQKNGSQQGLWVRKKFSCQQRNLAKGARALSLKKWALLRTGPTRSLSSKFHHLLCLVACRSFSSLSFLHHSSCMTPGLSFISLPLSQAKRLGTDVRTPNIKKQKSMKKHEPTNNQ